MRIPDPNEYKTSFAVYQLTTLLHEIPSMVQRDEARDYLQDILEELERQKNLSVLARMFGAR